jgi:DNA-binding GntR family transcriptional regulator
MGEAHVSASPVFPGSQGFPGESDDPAVRLPQRNVLADDVYQILKESLLSRRIEPGSRLNLDQLARGLHVSNTPVRQALARLESDGLVTKEPYRGFAASPLLDSRTIAELYDYRMLIEPPTAARAARRRQESAMVELETLCDVDQIGRLLADPSAQDVIGARDIEFHCGIAREAGSDVVLENLQTTLMQMRRYTIYHQHGAGEKAWEEHRAIALAIRAADHEAAAIAMSVHLTEGLDRLRKAIT